MKRAGIFFLATCFMLNCMTLPVSATGLPDDAENGSYEVIASEEGEVVSEEELVEDSEKETEETKDESVETSEEETTEEIVEETTEEIVEETTEDTSEETIEDASEMITEETDLVEEDVSEELIIDEESVLEDLLAANDTLNLTDDATYSSSALSVYKTIKLNGHQLTVPGDFTTSALIELGENGELLVNGDMKTSAEVRIDLGILTVKGNYTQTSERLRTVWLSNAATVNVSGDMIFKQNGRVETSEKTKVSVGGNVSYSSQGDSEYNPATWKVAGNIFQEEEVGFFDAGSIILNGSNPQILTLWSNSSVRNLTATNKNITIQGGYLNGATLQSDFSPVIEGNLKTNGIKLNGYKLVIPHDLEVTGLIDLGENGELLVNGDMKTSAEVRIDLGILTVKGNYTQTSERLRTVWLSNAATVNVSGDMIFKQNGRVETSEKTKVSVGGNVSYSSQGDSEYNPATWKVSGNLIQENESGSFTVGTLVLKKAGSEISLPNGSITTLTLGNGKSHYTINPDDCYDKLIATSKLTFNANGGTVKPTSTKVTTEEKYDTLPIPTRSGYNFDGWFTAKQGGSQIEKGQTVTAVDDFTVYAHWTEKPPMNYTDVKTSDWWYKAVKYAYDNNIMAGSGTKFNPTNKITREQFTQVLYNCEGKPAVSGKSPFPDVADKSGYPRDAIIWANQNNIMKGKADGTFGLGNNITRQDLAVALYKYAQYKGYDLDKNDTAINSFSDSKKVSGYAKNAMNWAVSQGIISGSNGNLNPAGNANRAECASMMKKLLEKNAK